MAEHFTQWTCDANSLLFRFYFCDPCRVLHCCLHSLQSIHSEMTRQMMKWLHVQLIHILTNADRKNRQFARLEKLPSCSVFVSLRLEIHFLLFCLHEPASGRNRREKNIFLATCWASKFPQSWESRIIYKDIFYEFINIKYCSFLFSLGEKCLIQNHIFSSLCFFHSPSISILPVSYLLRHRSSFPYCSPCDDNISHDHSSMWWRHLAFLYVFAEAQKLEF